MNSSLAIDSKLVFESTAMRRLLIILSRAAQAVSSILLTGETGTGKTELAKMAHQLSPRKDQPFVDANIAGNPESILESVLFGHVKGAYTGAVRERKGKFEEADGGTIFLDEIGDLSLAAQVTILKMIEEKKLERIGNGRIVNLDIRVISATNRNLREDIKKGLFRNDLFFRLNELEIHVPALRERPEDILPLAQLFLSQNAGEKGEYFLSEGAKKFISGYEWPGNIRELRSVLLNAIIRASEQKLRTSDLERIIGPRESGIRWVEFEREEAVIFPEVTIPQADLKEIFLIEDERARTEARLVKLIAAAEDACAVDSHEAEVLAEKVVFVAATSFQLETGVEEIFSLRKIMQSIRNKEVISLHEVVENAKNSLLKTAIETAKGNSEMAASFLGVCVSTFLKWKKNQGERKIVPSKNDSEDSCVLMADKSIQIGNGCDLPSVLRSLRLQFMLAALETTEGRQGDAAKLLSIKYRELWDALKNISASAVA